MPRVGIRDAARHYGVSIDTVRRRIAAGELTAERTVPGDERSPWLVEVPEPEADDTPNGTADSDGLGEVERLAHQLTVLERQLEARTREIAELHQLLASRMLPARIEQDSADSGQTPNDEGASTGQAPMHASPRPWWRFWTR